MALLSIPLDTQEEAMGLLVKIGYHHQHFQAIPAKFL
jgi:hypothetical protein